MFKDYLCHIANTAFGLYRHPFCQSWDALLNKILSEGRCLSADDYTATFSLDGDTYEIWTANHWCGCADLYRMNGDYAASHPKRPRFHTMRRLYAVIKTHRQELSR
jgi:hypothetical protein